MRMKFFSLSLTLFIFASPLVASAQESDLTDPIERGRYITHHVAMCIQCHTPRDKTGRLLLTQKFQGGPMPVNAPWENHPWCVRVPTIAGFLGYTEEEAIHFLQTGIRPDGTEPRPPMPPFRMTRADAEAVVAYLKSIE